MQKAMLTSASLATTSLCVMYLVSPLHTRTIKVRVFEIVAFFVLSLVGEDRDECLIIHLTLKNMGTFLFGCHRTTINI